MSQITMYSNVLSAWVGTPQLPSPSPTPSTTPNGVSPESLVYFVAFTGGFDKPSFFASTKRDAAEARYQQWQDEVDVNNGDRVSFLVWDGDTLRTA